MFLQDEAVDADELCISLSSFEKYVLLEISLFYDLKKRNRDCSEKTREENKRRKTAKKWESSEESKVPFEITALNQHHIHFCFCQLPTHFLF